MHEGGQRTGEEARRARQPTPGCAYLEPRLSRPPAAARPGAAASPRAESAARVGAPRPRAPSRAGVLAGLGWAADGWVLGRSRGAQRRCRRVPAVRVGFCALRCARRTRAPRGSLPYRAPAAVLHTEAARHPPRLLAARGRPLPAAGRWGRRGQWGPQPGLRVAEHPGTPLGVSENSVIHVLDEVARKVPSIVKPLPFSGSEMAHRVRPLPSPRMPYVPVNENLWFQRWGPRPAPFTSICTLRSFLRCTRARYPGERGCP